MGKMSGIAGFAGKTMSATAALALALPQAGSALPKRPQKQPTGQAAGVKKAVSKTDTEAAHTGDGNRSAATPHSAHEEASNEQADRPAIAAAKLRATGNEAQGTAPIAPKSAAKMAGDIMKSLENAAAGLPNQPGSAAASGASATQAGGAAASGIAEGEPKLVPANLSCADRFNLCMDDICKNENGIRHMCSTSIDSFDKVKRGGNDIQIGNELFAYARGNCVPALKNCPLAERNSIETKYKAQIQNDLLMKNYVDAMSYSGEEAAAASLQEYIACMAPLCGPSFTECFSITAVERRATKCEGALKNTGRPLAVKKAFYDELERLNKEMCAATGGYTDFDTKKCKITVVFGKPETIIVNGQRMATGKMTEWVGERIFNLGEMVECTQEYFAVNATENPGFWHGVVQVAKGGLKIVTGAVCVVAGAIASIAGGAGVPLIGSGVDLLGNGTADTMEGYVKMDGGYQVGACFVNNQLVAQLGQFFKVPFLP